MRKLLIPALCAMTLGLAAVAPQVDAKPAHGGHRMEAPGPQVERLFQQLNLTDAQKQQIKAIRERNMQAAKPVRESLRAKQKELTTLIKKADANKDQAIAKQREINALNNQLAESRLNSWFEARAVLTPDQLKKLETLQPRKMRRHEQKQ